MIRNAFATFIACAAACMLSAGAHAAAPSVISINAGYSFAEYSGPDAVGNGQISTPSTLFYIDEKVADGLKSWYLFFEPGRLQPIEATIHFDTGIQAVLTTRTQLDATNATYGIDLNGDSLANDYDSTFFIGLEPPNTVSWLPGGSDLHLRWLTIIPGDHIRVLAAVPEPATGAMLAAGLLSLGMFARRRSRH